MNTHISETQLEKMQQYWESEQALFADLLKKLKPHEQESLRNSDMLLTLFFRNDVSLSRKKEEINYLSMEAGLMSATVHELSSYAEMVRVQICDSWSYCKKRQALQAEGFQLAVTVADALLSMGVGLPLPVTAISVYLVKRQLLDKLCGCLESAG